MTDLPEIIDRLGANAWGPFIDPEGGEDVGMVRLPDAIQAVRDAEARVRGELAEAATQIDAMLDGRTREIVEALRDQADMLDPSDCLPPEDHYPTFRGWQGAAQFIERAFLSPDNPEGNA